MPPGPVPVPHMPHSKPQPPQRNTSSLALYEQVKEFISRKIMKGAWPPGHRLPSEQELVTQFGISRMTVNRALRELVAEGRIVRHAGVGSFVAEDKPQSTLLKIVNIETEILARGHDYRHELLVAERTSASPDVAAWLDLRSGASVFHVMSLHYENGTPVQLEERYVNPQIVPGFLEQDLAATPPGEYLLHNVPFDEIEHVVDAVLPHPDQARQLAMEATQPCLMLTRRTWSRGTPVTWVRYLHPASRYRLGSRFRPDGYSGAS
jgi:GntR family transcriptional regulator, histidine utilization repressor